MIIADASLAVKWLISETDSDDAETILERHEIAAPDLLIVEVAGAMVRRANQDKRLADTMRQALAQWHSFHAQLIDLHRLTPDHLSIAAEIA